MKKVSIYCIVLLLVISGCEEIYTPEIESRDHVIVAEARITAGQPDNVVRLYESRSFNDGNSYFPPVTGAQVAIVDNFGNRFDLQEAGDGLFPVYLHFERGKEYKLEISHNGDLYESSFEQVPEQPFIDSLYGIPEEKVVVPPGAANSGDFRKRAGVQIYADITHEKELPYFRFAGRKILQYAYAVEVVVMGEVMDETMYGWYSFYPQDPFNLAAPPAYSNNADIIKHPVFFLEEKAQIDLDKSFAGWILIFYQYGLTQSTYNYYKDLNNQLDSEGRLFDPLYVQARNNLQCTSDKNKLILGNFEISTMKEYRYFVQYFGPDFGYIIKPINHFYEIPFSGEQLGEVPEFWEHP